MICRKVRVFSNGKEFAEVAIVEDLIDGDYFIAVRRARTLAQLFRTRLNGAHVVDLFGGYEAASRSFDRRCHDLTVHGWQLARAA